MSATAAAHAPAETTLDPKRWAALAEGPAVQAACAPVREGAQGALLLASATRPEGGAVPAAGESDYYR
jgi:hypothetical protein